MNLFPITLPFFAVALIFLISTWGKKSDAYRGWVPAALTLIMCISFIHQFAYSMASEDAFISLRYCRNLVEGYGLVFNAGEWVEGYSNFLFIILIAGMHILTGLSIVFSAKLLSILSVLASVVLTYRLGTDIAGGRKKAGLIAALMTASSGTLAAYGFSMLETGFFVMLVITAYIFAYHHRWLYAGIFLGLATMTRPDGVIFFVSISVWALFSGKSHRIKTRQLFTLGAGYALLLLPWTAWRLSYYGHLTPNAIAAKKGMDFGFQVLSGMSYVSGFLLASFPVLILLGLALWTGRKKIKYINTEFEPGFFYLLFSLFAYTFFVILVGGDWMPAWRFMAPIVPLGAVLLSSLWDKSIPNSKLNISSQSSIIVFSIFSLSMLFISYKHRSMIPSARAWQHEIQGLSEIGKWLNRSLPPDTRIAVYANGALSYYSKLPTIDMLGLTDAHIARKGLKARRGTPGHIAADYPYVVRQKPEIVAFLKGQGFIKSPALAKAPPAVFKQEYVETFFKFQETTNPLGQYAVLLLLSPRKDLLVHQLSSDSTVTWTPFLQESPK